MKRILVVDDTKNIRTLLTTSLELKKYEVSTAKNGLEAIKLIQDEHFDLVFLDVKMPEISGTEVLKRIRGMGYTCPVIMMTAYATVKNAVDCTRLGAIAYLQKPFTVDKINEVLDSIASAPSPNRRLEEMLVQAGEFLDSRKTQEAYRLLRKCLSVSPDCAETYSLIAKVHMRAGNLELADKFQRMSTILTKI